MAQTKIALNDNEDRVQWSAQVNREAIQRTLFLRRFAGEGKNMPIQTVDDLANKSGSTVHTFLRPKITSKGRQGDETMEGHLARLQWHRDTVTIDQLRIGVENVGRVTDQRVPWNLRNDAKDALADRWAEVYDTWFANLLTGNVNETDTRLTGLHGVPTAATTIRRAGGQSDDQSITSSDIIAPADIDWLVNKAQTQSVPIRPVNIDGEDHYILVIHSNVLRTMRDTSGEFHAVWKSAMQGGRVSDNPIITGASLVWNNVCIYVNNYLPYGYNSSTTTTQVTDARASVFMGAQAACLAFGRGYGKNRMDWVEELSDFENTYGVVAGVIAGAKKYVYNSADHGVIRYVSYAPDPS